MLGFLCSKEGGGGIFILHAHVFCSCLHSTNIFSVASGQRLWPDQHPALSRQKCHSRWTDQLFTATGMSEKTGQGPWAPLWSKGPCLSPFPILHALHFHLYPGPEQAGVICAQHPLGIQGKIISLFVGYDKNRLQGSFPFGELYSCWKKKVVFQLFLVDYYKPKLWFRFLSFKFLPASFCNILLCVCVCFFRL